jgi:hypothetical protein
MMWEKADSTRVKIKEKHEVKRRDDEKRETKIYEYGCGVMNLQMIFSFTFYFYLHLTTEDIFIFFLEKSIHWFFLSLLPFLSSLYTLYIQKKKLKHVFFSCIQKTINVSLEFN